MRRTGCSTRRRSGYDESQALIAKWHGRGRLLYAITPRFAGTSSPEQLAAAGRLWREHPGMPDADPYRRERRTRSPGSRSCFPIARNYLDVYDHHGLCGPRAVFGHGIWLEEAELQRLHASGAAIAHCPTSNFFLGSGAFDLVRALKRERPVRVGLGTDIGAGTSLLDPGHAGRGLQGRPAQSPAAVGWPRLLSRHPRRGARPLPRRPDRQHRARHGGRPRGARHALHAADRLPHEAGPRPGRAALHPDDPGRRPCRPGDYVAGRLAYKRPPLPPSGGPGGEPRRWSRSMSQHRRWGSATAVRATCA